VGLTDRGFCLKVLSEALHGAVASAVEGAVERAVRQAVGQAVQEAVQAVLTEILTNADLLAGLRAVLPAAPPGSTTDPPERPKGLFRRACDGIKAGLAAAGTACAAVLGQAAGVKTLARAAWQLARRFKGRLLAACGVGFAAGAVTFWAGPWVGAGIAWLGGFVATSAVQARNGLRRLLSPPAFA
jgi:hypothetical protein